MVGHRNVVLCWDFTLTLPLSLKGEGGPKDPAAIIRPAVKSKNPVHSVHQCTDTICQQELCSRRGWAHPHEDAGLDEVAEISRAFQRSELSPPSKEAPSRFQLVAMVAKFAEVLRGSYWASEASRPQQLMP